MSSLNRRRATTYFVRRSGAITVSSIHTFINANSSSDIWRLPDEYYPIDGFNQMVLRIYIHTMPTLATFVDFLPLSHESELGFGAVPSPGFIDPATGLTYAAAAFSYDKLGSPSDGIVTPQTFRIRRTAVDTVTDTTNIGTRVALPLCDDYFGIMILTDGTSSGTGAFTMFATLGWV